MKTKTIDQYSYYARHGSTTNKNGWPSIPIVPATRKPAIRHWESTGITDEQVNLWSGTLGHCGVGIRTGFGLIGRDNDIDCPQASKLYDRITTKHFGLSPKRMSSGCRSLIPYRCNESLRKGVKSYEKTESDGQTSVHQTELLAEGQQFVGLGIHHRSRKPYTWLNGSPIDTGVKQLPLVTLDQVLACERDFEQQLLSLPGWRLLSSSLHNCRFDQLSDSTLANEVNDADELTLDDVPTCNLRNFTEADIRQMAKYLLRDKGYAHNGRDDWKMVVLAVKSIYPMTTIEPPDWLIKLCQSDEHPDYDRATRTLWRTSTRRPI